MSRSIASFVFAALTSLMILGTNGTNAQSIISRYGKDSAKCVTNLALYREYYKQKNYKDAIVSWRYVFNNCPQATENIFINGANMYNSFIAAEKDCASKQKLIDTLLLIYDIRTKYWGNEGKQLANKANDLLNADSSRSFEAYGMLKRSIDLLKNNSEESTLRNYCSSAIGCFNSGKISSDAIIELFNQTESIIDTHISPSAGNTDSQRWIQLKKLIEINIFPLLQCKDISTIFTPKLTAKPDDLALLKRVSEILFHRGCTEDSLYLFTLEKINAFEPDVNTAFLIAREYLKRKNVPKAVESLNNVADKLKDDASKARCSYYLGAVYADSKDFSNARSNALKAIQFKSDYGEAYLLIADCYAQSALECGKDNVISRAAFWCAVDKLNQAKKVDPKLESTVNNLINQYSRNFPTKEMLLAGKLKIGSKYLVECWINETTTVRSNTEIKK
jgi:tetratricopeptide (TPR) repeat protein